METISGTIERITYYNEENGFVVAKLQEKGKRDLTTIVGNLSAIALGESLKITGQWVVTRDSRAIPDRNRRGHGAGHSEPVSGNISAQA